MQGETEQLLQAVAKFLDQELRPAVTDPGLAFRTRIAASLLRSLASERPAERELEEIEAMLELPMERFRTGVATPIELSAARRAVHSSLRARVRARSPEVDLDEPGA